MARRRSTPTATSGSLDSMLDTLMNVVGILVIVLVAVQISSQEVASRIAEHLKNVSPQDIATLEKAAEAAKRRAATTSAAIRALTTGATDPKAELSRLRAQLQVEEDLAQQAEARAARLQREHAAALTAAQRIAQQSDATIARKKRERDAMKARLEKIRLELERLPTLDAPPTKEVRLPDPRPAPAKVIEIHVLCREGRIWLVDIPALQEKALRRADFVVRSKKLDPDGDRWITDGNSFTEEFNKSPVKEGGFEMTLVITNNRWPHILLTRMQGRGETVDEAVKASGGYSRALRRLGPKTHVLRFFVWPDSFEPYLKVRELAGSQGYAAGWEPMTSPDEYRIPLGKYSIGAKPPPKPADPNAKPPPPKNVLD